MITYMREITCSYHYLFPFRTINNSIRKLNLMISCSQPGPALHRRLRGRQPDAGQSGRTEPAVQPGAVHRVMMIKTRRLKNG